MYRRYLKRCLDFALALIALASLSWLLIGVATVYLIIGERPIFFLQARTGRSARSFMLYKFRTLSCDTSLPLVSRQFSWGNFLRRTSLDELPQLINVLKGDMSLVGPRPLPIEYESFYSAEQATRHSVKPGITGLAQVNGRHSISWSQKFAWDVRYVDQLSFLLDLKIILKTVLLIFSFKKDVSLKEEKFAGNG